MADIEKEIKRVLTLYAQEAHAEVAAATEYTAEEGKKKIKSVGGYKDRTGKYRKSFYLKDTSTHLVSKRVLANRQHQLTHLLENGHAIHGGTGRAKAYPHWKATEEYMIDLYTKELLKRLGAKP